MAVTVHEAKRTRASLEEALESAAEFLGRHPKHGGLAGQAKMAAARLAGVAVGGKEVDPAEAGTVAALREAAAVGRSVITQSDAGRKVPRLTSRIEEAERLLGS